jgi:hypothetical protein
MRTWNDHLQREKYFMRRIYNQKQGIDKNQDEIEISDWTNSNPHNYTLNLTKRTK